MHRLCWSHKLKVLDTKAVQIFGCWDDSFCSRCCGPITTQGLWNAFHKQQHVSINYSWFIIPLTDYMDVNIQRENIQSGWQSVFPKHHHAVLLGQSSSATHSYLLGYIFTLYPSLHCDPVRSHLLMFITVSHLPEEDDWRFSVRAEVGLARSFFSNRGSRGGGFPIHTLIMSQLPDISETKTVGGYFVSKSSTGKLSL